jgi:2,3-bisphosphoglycerate-independent phosphoglycerate mutase
VTSPLVCLVILDGWGLAPPGPGNAVDLAGTPAFDRLWAAYPHTQLDASGRAVGLPDGQMGNSEVGHTNLGAGRVVRQDLVRIDDDIESGAFFENPVLVDACRKARGSALHLLGLVSDGGVHSHLRHLRALIELASREGVEHVHVHAFTDGRDTSPHGGVEYLDGLPGVATVVGRYYAMDRDRRWDRAKRAYDAIVHGVGARADDAVEAVKASYAAGVTDEFIEPVVIGDPSAGRIRSGDAAIFFNFRPDRARELSWALTQAGFTGFDRGPDPPLPHYVQMTEYADDITAPVAFPGEDLADVLAQALAGHGVAQLHVAETEKYAHVTYFFDGGSETRCAGEEWELVDSPRDVPTYDKKPSMSADEVADHVVNGLADDRYGFCLVNFANPDMVGHTGVIPAAVEAVETADRCLARVAEAVAARGGVCLVTADHGNAETMLHPDGSPHTAHTTNPVPLIATDDGLALRSGGRLADIAPTVLDLLGLPAPAAMTGESLLERTPGGQAP